MTDSAATVLPPELIDAARTAGVATGFHDIWGHWHTASASTITAALRALGHQGETPLALLESVAAAAAAAAAHAPSAGADAAGAAHADTVEAGAARCVLRPALAHGAREWGLAVQLYSLRSQRNWGIGDFTDLHALIDAAAALGARVIGLNPLHALPLERPEQASPYSALSRLFLNAMYIDPDRVAAGPAAPEFAHRLAQVAGEPVRAALRAGDHVDYGAVAQVKLAVLRMCFDAFAVSVLDQPGNKEGAAFALFRATTPGLREHATFQSIQHALHAEDASVWGWPCWPQALQDPGSPAVAQWQQDHAPEIAFFEFLEWQARLQWQDVREHAGAAGVALYGDLALGADRGGSEVWAAQSVFALGVNSGCPPDDFNLQGQDWGLPPYRPDLLARTAAAAFAAMLRATMAQFDALRLDHVMSLMRLFWIPPGCTAASGVYVDYPFETMLRALCAESRRSGCMVIGEDLGTVPPQVREALAGADVLSYRLLVFERESATRFRPPHDYPRLALAAVGSHDSAPLQGWWSGDDLRVRERLGLLTSEQYHRFSWERGEARQALLWSLAEAGLLPEGVSADPAAHAQLPPALVDAIHVYLARAPSMWLMINPEDAFDLVDATNLPGTTTEHVNWRRRLPVAVEDWSTHPRLREIARRVGEVRG
jgi:(1->4)-alpha-D-glucan 1-alpha-D-glucosylmutase